MRKIIAKRLLESKLTLPHSYMAIEIEMDNLMATRAKFNKQNSSKVVLADSSICSVDLDTDLMIDIDCPALLTTTAMCVPQVSVNDLVIKAVAYALKAVPEANAYWTEDAIKFHPTIDVSFAAATVCVCVCARVRSCMRLRFVFCMLCAVCVHPSTRHSPQSSPPVSFVFSYPPGTARMPLTRLPCTCAARTSRPDSSLQWCAMLAPSLSSRSQPRPRTWLPVRT